MSLGGFSASGNEERRHTRNARWRNGADAAVESMAEVKAAGAYAVGFIWSEWNVIQRSMTHHARHAVKRPTGMGRGLAFNATGTMCVPIVPGGAKRGCWPRLVRLRSSCVNNRCKIII